MQGLASIALLAFVLYFFHLEIRQAVAHRFLLPVEPAASNAQPVFEQGFVCRDCGTKHVHAASITTTGAGDLLAVWYGGTREGAKDVALYSARLAPGSTRWSKPKRLLGRFVTEAGLHRYIKKIGNPVIARAPDGRLWLFYVTVSMGGWSGSAINYVTSHDDGESWSHPRRLVTSPFFNVSTLVKTAPVFYTDGTIGLPVYHELLGHFAEFLHLSHDGRVLAKTRISSGAHMIQPAVVPLGQSRAMAWMRDTAATHRIWRSETRDGGRHWSVPVATTLPNPNSAVAAAPASGGNIVLVFNDETSGRDDLSVSIGPPDGPPTRLRRIEELVPGRHSEVSYPYMVRTADGNYHLVYTWNRTGIRYVVFNEAWLRQKDGRP
jgi:predicted neuraminidase